ncbi:hypothetical protein Tco_0035448 [Tanacetum coccineum]
MIIEDIQVTMALLPPGFLEPLYQNMINNQDIEHMIPPTPPRDIEPPVGSPISLSPSSSVGSSSPVRSTTPPPDYPFDKSKPNQMLIRVPISGSLRFQKISVISCKVISKDVYFFVRTCTK